MLQRRDRPDPATYVGKGKAEELRELAEALDIDVVVFDDELTPAQQRNLEQLFERDVVDRVALILDIFAQHATSQEGMVQVELAQLRYRLPRLRGRGLELSQQGGGIGTRGPGETQLEVDRRRIQRRITKLERDLDAARPHPRDAAQGAPAPGAADASRSSGTRTRASRRCSTGSPTRTCSSRTGCSRRSTRRPGGCGSPAARRSSAPTPSASCAACPHQLVEAFRSTLEEVADADLLVHVVDGSAPDAASARSRRCARCSARSAPATLPELLVVNKTDAADPDVVADLLARPRGSVAVSARDRRGHREARRPSIGDRLRALAPIVELLVPYDRGDVLAALHRDGEVLVEVHADDGTRVRARLPDRGGPVRRVHRTLSRSSATGAPTPWRALR